MGRDELHPETRSRGRYVSMILLAALLLVVGAGAGMMVGFSRPRGDATTSHDAALPEGAVLVVGTAEVDVEGGLLPLAPVLAGRIKTVQAIEGQTAAAGAPLLELDTTQADADVDLAAINVRTAEVAHESAEQSARQHAGLVDQQKIAVSVAETRLKTQKAQTERAEQYFKERTLKVEELETARDLLKLAEESVRSEKLKLAQLQATDPTLAVRTAKVQIDLAQRKHAAAKSARALMTLTAPTAGSVLRVMARQGQVWTGLSREPAVWFRPDRPWIVRCEVEQHYAARVHVGLPCDIYDDRLDAPAWKGKVQSCSNWIAPRRAFADDPLARRDQRVVECVIALDNPDDHLRVGQRVRVVVRSQ